MQTEIIVTISKDGATATTEVQGVKGKSCTDITKQLLEAIGTITQDKKTPDYYMENVDVVNNRL